MTYTTPPAPARYNVFNQIHKALRGMLYDAATSIQQTDFASDDALATISKVDHLLALFDEHADHEDHHILSNVERHEPQLVAAFEEDHVIDHRLTEALAAQLDSWRTAAGREQRLQAGLSLFYSFNEFIAFNLYHMNKEENELLFVLWKHFSDEEIHGMEHLILQDIRPETLQFESRWMMRMLSVPEITAWLSGVRAGAPAEVFEGMLMLAAAELSPKDYRAVLAAMAIEPALA